MLQYPTVQEISAIRAAEQVMVETMARYDPSHDLFHVQRVRNMALALGRAISSGSTYKPDLLVIEIASLLHDVLDKKYVTPAEAEDPYGFFLPFFHAIKQEHGLDLIKDGRARLITRIIENVSWSTEKILREASLLENWHRDCVELHCVQDADRLDAIGAFGILRCAAYSAVTNHPLHTPPGDPAEAVSAIQHFQDKLLHIKNTLKTEQGKRLGEKRHQMLIDFLASVKEEYEVGVLALRPSGT